MRHLLFVFSITVFIACRNSSDKIENKVSICEDKNSKPLEKDEAEYTPHGNINNVVKMADYDTIYRFRSHAGWGAFDYICSIYKELDTPRYKVQLLQQRSNEDSIYNISEKDLSLYEWDYFRKRFKDVNFWCFEDSVSSKICVDCNSYYMTAKELNTQKRINWSEAEIGCDVIKGVGTDMLELADFPTHYAMIYCTKIKDSVKIEMFPYSTIQNNLVKKVTFKHPFNKNGENEYGAYTMTISKKDFKKIDDIEMKIELFNGKSRTTTEKVIKKINF